MKKMTVLLNIFLSVSTVMVAMENQEAPKKTEVYDDGDVQFQGGKDLLMQKFPNLEHYKRILDFGCRLKLAAFCATKVEGSEVVGVDFEEPLVKKLQETFKHLEPNLTFKYIDPANFDLKKTFQLIFSYAVFQFVSKQQEALNNIAHALEPDGRFLLTTVKKDEDSPIVTAFEQVLGSSEWASYEKQLRPVLQNLLTKEELRSKLANAGLKLIELEETCRSRVFGSRKELAEFIHTWIGFVEGINKLEPELRSNFVEKLIDEYVKIEPAKEDGSILYYIPALLVQAQKSNWVTFSGH